MILLNDYMGLVRKKRDFKSLASTSSATSAVNRGLSISGRFGKRAFQQKRSGIAVSDAGPLVAMRFGGQRRSQRSLRRSLRRSERRSSQRLTGARRSSCRGAT
jgi:hypothetical protein